MGPKSLFTTVVSDGDYERVLNVLGTESATVGMVADPGWTRLSRRLRPWFWPQVSDAAVWASASESGWYAPSSYLIDEPGPLLQQLMHRTPVSHSILDLGCNSGANLNFLYEAGYRKLAGVDAGREALSLFFDTFPDTYNCVKPHHDLFQHYLLSQPDDAYDVLHSNGATIELVHPSFPVVAEICRVARDSVFLDICERGHAYPRRYVEQFARHGFELTYKERPDDLINSSSILIFKRKIVTR